MAGNTPSRNLPYPTSTDPLSSFPALMQAAMTNLDGHSHAITIHGHSGLPFKLAAGQTNVTMNGSGAAQADIDLRLAGFTKPPIIVAVVEAGSGNFLAFVPNGVTKDTGKVGVKRADGTSSTSTVTVAWIAIQITDGQAAGAV